MRILLVFCLLLVSCTKDKPYSPRINVLDTTNTPAGCLSIDTDGDGLLDCKDPDKDNDGVLNEVDKFPLDRTEWADSDNDGVGDNKDVFDNDPFEWADNDGDLIGDNSDEDDDNDGIPDLWDKFTTNNEQFFDIDGDKIGDTNLDPDIDNDGVPNFFDDVAWKSDSYFDIDHDLIGNSIDDDIDGDGYFNLIDAFPYDNTEWIDTDLDGYGNNIDPDDDNDGLPDTWEDYPLDFSKKYDSDSDSYENSVDDFPFDASEHNDLDGDGVGDNSDIFPNNPLEWSDYDADGIGDNSDDDIDNDGFFNCIPLDLNTTAICNKDSFPFDRFEWVDTDKDNVGNNADEDDDNDGTPDVFDAFSLEKKYDLDFDKDGVPDSTFPQNEVEYLNLLSEGKVYFIEDPDLDNDGVPNYYDAFPWDAFEYFDIDNDGIGNKTDLDDDGDGVLDFLDKFPFDPTESGDNDNDGIGNNSDPDDDNDGAPDYFDVLSFNKNGFADTDGDLIPNSTDNDIDGDGFGNGSLFCEQNYNFKICEEGSLKYLNIPIEKCLGNYQSLIGTYCYYNASNDEFIWDLNEWADFDKDLVGNNSDPDDDNDGAPDALDSLSLNQSVYFDIDNDSLDNSNDNDIDGDGLSNLDLVCRTNGNNLVQNPWMDSSEKDLWVNSNGAGVNFSSGKVSILNSAISQTIQNSGTNTYNFDYTVDVISNGATASLLITDMSDSLLFVVYKNIDGSFKNTFTLTGDFKVKIVAQNGQVSFDNVFVTLSSDDVLCNYRNETCVISEGLQICTQFDHFPFDSNFKLDNDNDGIPDELDDDIDGDGKTNCVPVDLNTANSCNEDQLPYVGLNHLFLQRVYTNGIVSVDYCFDKNSNPKTCHYINVDRDNDGLTDYEEFLNFTNPESIDSDNDTVPDNVEVVEGSDPNDSNEYFDNDSDGIPDYLDLTPKGAFDESSFLAQLNRANECYTFVNPNTCIDNDFGLCYWKEKVPTQLVPDPLNNGNFMNDGICTSKDIILTQDIELNQCLELNVDLKIKGRVRNVNNITQDSLGIDDRYSLIFKQSNLGSSLTCNPLNLTAITTNNKLELEKINIITEQLDTGIDSLGDYFKANNVYFSAKNDNLTTLLNASNNDAILDLNRVTFRSNVNEINPPIEQLKPIIKINQSSQLNLAGVLTECDIYNYINQSDLFNCVEISTLSLNISGSIFSLNATYSDALFSNDSNAIKANYDSLSFNNSRIYSKTKSANLSGANTNITNDVFSVNGADNENILLNNITNPLNLIIQPTYQSIFDLNNKIKCDKNVLNNFFEINPSYFESTPIQSYFNQLTIPVLNDGDSTNLTPDGSFNSNGDFNTWLDPTYLVGDNSGNSLFTVDAVYENFKAKIDSSTGSSGIGRYLFNLNTSKSYQLSFNIEEVIPATLTTLNFTANIIDADTNNLIKSINISYGASPDVVSSDGLVVQKQVLFDVNKVIQNFELKYLALDEFGDFVEINPTNIIISIGKSTNSGYPIYIDNIKLLESFDLNIQYPGVIENICK